jgi:thiol:disulfide interchange protein DsbA
MNSKAKATAARSERQMNRLRHVIVGSVLILIAVVLGLGIYHTTRSPSGTFAVGEHYVVLDTTSRRRPGEPILVQEFFSYGCVHCRNFDPMIEAWKKDLPADVLFQRVPVTFSPAWTLLAQTYYALEEVGTLERHHARLFRAIHDTGRQFLTLEAMADFIADSATTREAFLAAANGPSVRSRLREAERSQRTLMIPSVPSLVVANRYLVGMDTGRRTALEIVDHLIAEERAAAQADATATDG